METDRYAYPYLAQVWKTDLVFAGLQAWKIVLLQAAPPSTPHFQRGWQRRLFSQQYLGPCFTSMWGISRGGAEANVVENSLRGDEESLGLRYGSRKHIFYCHAPTPDHKPFHIIMLSKHHREGRSWRNDH